MESGSAIGLICIAIVGGFGNDFHPDIATAAVRRILATSLGTNFPVA
jgi:hypothetical protein